MLRLVTVAAIALFLASPVSAQDRSAELDAIFRWATPSAPGCSVAVAQQGKVVFSRAYGSADLERDVPLTPDSVFDAGSLQKQFVAAAALLLVEEGRLSLSDDIRKHVPELPDYGHKITIDHLMTHTSGLRDWTGIMPLASGDPDVLTVIFRQRGVNFVPGEEWAYSNSGYVLLKEIVARASGMSFAELTRKRLFEPLGMKTVFTDDLRQVIRKRALAYDKENGQWKMSMLLDNERGGLALLATASDLLLWNEALTSGRLGAFVTAKLQEPATLNDGRKLGYARGLFLDRNRGGRVIWHGGSAAGSKGVLSRYPEQGLSIAILCNSGDGTDRIASARRIFDVFVPASVAAAPERKAPVATNQPVDLAQKAGWFFDERTGQPLRLAVDGERLRVAGGPPLVPVAADRFLPADTDLQFLSEEEFEVRFSPEGLELRSAEGKTTKYRRAHPYTPAAAELEALAGRYASDEIGAVFEITPASGGLVITLAHARDKRLELKPLARDLFHRGMMTVRFRRDSNGKVTGLDYSNPLLRNIPFTR